MQQEEADLHGLDENLEYKVLGQGYGWWRPLVYEEDYVHQLEKGSYRNEAEVKSDDSTDNRNQSSNQSAADESHHQNRNQSNNQNRNQSNNENGPPEREAPHGSISSDVRKNSSGSEGQPLFPHLSDIQKKEGQLPDCSDTSGKLAEAKSEDSESAKIAQNNRKKDSIVSYNLGKIFFSQYKI